MSHRREDIAAAIEPAQTPYRQRSRGSTPDQHASVRRTEVQDLAAGHRRQVTHDLFRNSLEIARSWIDRASQQRKSLAPGTQTEKDVPRTAPRMAREVHLVRTRQEFLRRPRRCTQRGTIESRALIVSQHE